MPTLPASIHIDPARIIDKVDPRIYSGFTEHMGRCIYGGIYEPDNKNGLSDPESGFRLDVLDVLKELDIPLVRYPGGYVAFRLESEPGYACLGLGIVFFLGIL